MLPFVIYHIFLSLCLHSLADVIPKSSYQVLILCDVKNALE